MNPIECIELIIWNHIGKSASIEAIQPSHRGLNLSKLIWCAFCDPCNYEIIVNKSHESLYLR
ncbi:hypothetical protein HYPGJ_31108 [Hyphomicrobium sp. GJ21]|nr:hypothetical protein HYPGJ_31108 [Hyphomicrobium sp. GJ21]